MYPAWFSFKKSFKSICFIAISKANDFIVLNQAIRRQIMSNQISIMMRENKTNPEKKWNLRRFETGKNRIETENENENENEKIDK